MRADKTDSLHEPLSLKIHITNRCKIMNESQITLTERAASHVKDFLAKQGHGIGLRVGVKPAGCSGHQYIIEAADAIQDHDQTFDINGVQVVIDELSLKYLAGTELDYVTEGLNSSFRFNNPNVTDTCGCGESFTVDEKFANSNG